MIDETSSECVIPVTSEWFIKEFADDYDIELSLFTPWRRKGLLFQLYLL